jgi:hypothetical protein
MLTGPLFAATAVNPGGGSCRVAGNRDDAGLARSTIPSCPRHGLDEK